MSGKSRPCLDSHTDSDASQTAPFLQQNQGALLEHYSLTSSVPDADVAYLIDQGSNSGTGLMLLQEKHLPESRAQVSLIVPSSTGTSFASTSTYEFASEVESALSSTAISSSTGTVTSVSTDTTTISAISCAANLRTKTSLAAIPVIQSQVSVPKPIHASLNSDHTTTHTPNTSHHHTHTDHTIISHAHAQQKQSLFGIATTSTSNSLNSFSRIPIDNNNTHLDTHTQSTTFTPINYEYLQIQNNSNSNSNNHSNNIILPDFGFASSTLLALDSLNLHSDNNNNHQLQDLTLDHKPPISTSLATSTVTPIPTAHATATTVPLTTTRATPSPEYINDTQINSHPQSIHSLKPIRPLFTLSPIPNQTQNSINHDRRKTSVNGFKLKLPDNPYQTNLIGSTSASQQRPDLHVPASPNRTLTSAKISTSPIHSPSVSPRKRLIITGSRYSPPPAFMNPLSASSNLPPPTPPLPKSPAAFETATSDYFNASPPKTSPAKFRIINTTTEQKETSPVRSHQGSKSSLVGKKVITAATTISTTFSNTRQRASTMATEAGRRAMRSASGTRPAHGRQFSTDMRQTSSEDVARHREQREKDRDRKAMLNRALQKAHTAVLLDNAYNYEGAIDAYREACNLLHQVLLRSTADEERRKLDQIRETYSKRINELVETERETAPVTSSSSAPPATSAPSSAAQRSCMTDRERSTREDPRPQSRGLQAMQTRRPESPAETISDTSTVRHVPPKLMLPASSFGQLSAPMDPSLAPPPLSPRRNPPSIPSLPDMRHDRSVSSEKNLQDQNNTINSHSTGGSTSWLGTLSSTASSERSSTQSVEQANAARKTYLSNNLDDTQAEFDAALDAAVEAAYDDGFEPVDISNISYTNGSYSGAPPPLLQVNKSRGQNGVFYVDAEEEDDERTSLDAPKDHALEDFDFGLQKKSSSTRDSDGSQFSEKTWHSSVASSRTTQSTSLSTVSEGLETTLLSGTKVLGTLPRLSEETSRPDSISGNDLAGAKPAPLSLNPSASVRSRRMSGQNAKQLKIETMPGIPPSVPQLQPPVTIVDKHSENHAPPRSSESSQTELPEPEMAPSKNITPQQHYPGLAGASLYPMPTSAGSRQMLSPTETTFTISPATPGLQSMLGGESPLGFRPHNRPFLRKNKSSMSLKARTLSVSSPDGSDGSVATPMSQTFSYGSVAMAPSALSRKTTGLSTTQTHSMPHLNENNGPTAGNGNIAMFDADIHSPATPGFPNPLTSNAPVALEPCPEPVLLRPFWLLRCIYQTIAHPRGGYVSTKLFIPRDVWKVKAVKLKAIEEKIAQFDLLTHALSRLNTLDTNDMQAVLEEMQHFEGTLDHVQNVLSKKLGHEVGTHGLNSMFKDAPNEAGSTGGSEDAGKSTQGHRSSSKSYLPSSWRKLRSKTSSSALSAQNNASNRGSGPKDSKDEVAPTMTTVPMTTLLTIKFAKRDVHTLDATASNMGPNAAYMASLARLCDAVQVVDLIARQVEDPGLRGSSSVHVGLELCTRHASEFFGFFICRIILADVGLLLDKYLKRGTEWVLA